MTIEIVYEDSDLLVAVKPAGMVVHPAYRHADGTFWDALVPLFRDRGIAEGPHLLHRLDRDTSGLLCIPKRPEAHRVLARALEKGAFTKGYLALVHGLLDAPELIDAPLARDPDNRRFVRVTTMGKAARTHVRVLRRWADCTLLRVQLDTGRTHQIRAHLMAIDHPVVGDVLYGPQPPTIDRLFLHADRLTFPHPAGSGTVSCRSPLPSELRQTLCRLAIRATSR